MSLLTEQEIDKCIGITDYTTGAMKNVLTQIARAIEAKVIEKIKAQGATAYLEGNPKGIWFVAYSVNTNAPQIPLYRLPEGD